MDGLKDSNDRDRPKKAEDKIKKKTYESALYEGRKLIYNTFRGGIFSIKTQGKRLRILPAKQML